MTEYADGNRDLECMARDAFATSPKGAYGALVAIAKHVGQYGDGVAKGASLVYERLGPLPPAVDGGVRNILIASSLLESACEALAEALGDARYESWPEAVRDREGRLRTVPDPARPARRDDRCTSMRRPSRGSMSTPKTRRRNGGGL